MALTNTQSSLTQSSLSDLFTARANDTRMSSSARKRNARVESGDFGALFASLSAKPAAKASAKSATSPVEKSNDRDNSSAKKSKTSATTRPATTKRSTAIKSTASKKNTSSVSRHERTGKFSSSQTKDTTHKVDGKASAVKNAIEKINSTNSVELLATENTGSGVTNASGGIAPETQFGFGAKGLAVDAGLLSKMNLATVSASPLAGSSLFASATSDATLVDGTVELTSKVFGQATNLDDATGRAHSNSPELPKVAPNNQASISQLVSLTDGTDLKSIESLIKEFDVKATKDSSASADGKLGADNLKALEQLNSVKLVAPTVVRSLMAQKPERREVISKSQATTTQTPTGAIQSFGITANNAIELASVQSQNSALNKEFFALQQGGLDDGLKLDGKSASLEAVIQLQTEGADAREAEGAKNAKAVGKLVVPAKFGAMLKSGVQSLRLQIAPKHLGAAELTVKLIRDHVQGTLTVTSESARVAALNSMDSLAERLSAEGLVLDSLNVEVSQDGSSQGRNELERQYSDVLQSGLMRRAFEQADDFYPVNSVERSVQPLTMDIINPANVDIHA